MAISLAAAAAQLFVARGLTLAVAESCTGGLLGDLLTDVPGSSRFFLGGVIAYAYQAKTILLGLSPEFLLEHTSVSAPVALAMAAGVRTRLGADLALAITGLAGPGGGSETKPVGLTFVGLAAPDFQGVRQFVWQGDRSANKRSSAGAALEFALDYLHGRLPPAAPS